MIKRGLNLFHPHDDKAGREPETRSCIRLDVIELLLWRVLEATGFVADELKPIAYFRLASYLKFRLDESFFAEWVLHW